MPEFSWEPLDFLDVLGVVPQEEEFGVSYHYAIIREHLRLELTVWVYNSDVDLSIYVRPQEQPVIRLNLLGCPGARVVNDKRGKFIEFAAANLLSGRFDAETAPPYGFRLWVEPAIRVEPFAY